MAELESRLRTLGRQLEHPPQPELAAWVAARLDAEPARPPRPAREALRGRRVPVFALLAVLLLGATAAAAVHPVREALLDALGVGGVEVESTSAPPPAVEQRPLELGRRTTLARARRSLSFAPQIPRALGAADELFVRRGVPGGELSLVYAPSAQLPPTGATGVGLLITEFRGDLLEEYLRKIVPQATTVERLRVDGGRAAWISGAPHFFFYGDPRGAIAERDLEVAENVLLLNEGAVLVRLEGAFSKPEAVRIASSLAPG